MSGSVDDIDALKTGVLRGDRRALARAITLVESAKAQDQDQASTLLTALLPQTGNAIRIGISGAPGAGKSTFIEAFGGLLTEQSHKVAVLAIDPSSRRSGGSILGDKTRMELLARNPNAFIRPSPAGATLGGVARRTRESLLLVEAAGFDVVLVETVGAGQSETTVAEMTDLFVALFSPGGGDELQGIKRGMMELADILLVTKADGDLVPAANRAAADYKAALHLMRPKYPDLSAKVLQVSAQEKRGVAEAWTAMQVFHAALQASGQLTKLRAHQRKTWLSEEIQSAITDRILCDAAIAGETDRMEEAVIANRMLPSAAARMLAGKITTLPDTSSG